MARFSFRIRAALTNVLNPVFVQSVYPTPIFSANQLGLPEAMRYSQKTDFSPRIGFAWKPFNSNRTVVRGGYGRFIEIELGALGRRRWHGGFGGLRILWELHCGREAAITFPYPFPSNLAQPGSQSFALGFPLHFQDPTIHEWDLTLEQDLGKGIGMRLSYDGNHSSTLGMYKNIDEVPANTIGFAAASAFAPFPLWGSVAYAGLDRRL